MNIEKLLKEYLKSKGVEAEGVDLSDFLQHLENNRLAILDKVNRQLID